jgi:hypothetical protein
MLLASFDQQIGDIPLTLQLDSDFFTPMGKLSKETL